MEVFYRETILDPFDALIWGEVDSRVIEGELVNSTLAGTPELFDWHRFKSEPDLFPHIRLIAKSGMGKTTLAEYLMSLLGGHQFIITPKRKPKDWLGFKVYGSGFNYPECLEGLNHVKELMISNYQLIDADQTPPFTNFVCDEWRLIAENVPEAQGLMKEIITIARDAQIRMIAIAQGEQVKTWGLEGESDLGECFTTIRLGKFATDYARKIRLPQSTIDWLQRQTRPCMVDDQPAEIPDLSQFRASRSAVSPQIGSGAERIVHQVNDGLDQVSTDLQGQFLKTGDTTPETTENQGFQPPETSFSSTSGSAEIALLEGILGAFAEGKSDDWVAKHLVMPAASCGYPKARERVEKMRSLLERTNDTAI
jgi:hypothetical protein